MVTISLEERVDYVIVVETVEAKFDMIDEPVYDFAYGIDTPNHNKVINSMITGPLDINLNNIKLQYLARKEGTATITIPEIVILEGILSIPSSTFDVELGELWLDIDSNVEAVDLEDIIDDIIENLQSALESFQELKKQLN